MSPSDKPDPTDRPNVVFILTDDQGVWAAGCYGNPEIRTPNIDRIAAGGLRFDNFFVATPVCSPSRATFFTGRIPSQHGIHDWIKPPGNCGPEAVRYLKGETAYTDTMSRHGYSCALSGKWHLGDAQRPQFSFEHWYTHQRGSGPYNDAPMVRDGKLIMEPGYITDVITDDALEVIEQYAARQPFYLSVHYTAPHAPWTGHPQEIVDSYDDCAFESCPQEPRHPWAGGLTDRCHGNREMLKGYFAAVTAMDLNVGRILDKLEELGLCENTLLIFASDNGFSCGHHGFWGKGNGTNPRNMYENSVKVPAIFSHPGRISQGRTTRAMVSAYDFMPTLLDYLDLPMPEAGPLPGTSFRSVLEGGEEGGPARPGFSATGNRAPRSEVSHPSRALEVQASPGGRGSVVVYDEYGPVRMVRTREWKYVCRHPDGPHDLFDLVNDPGERRNLAGDASHRGRIREMRAMLDDWFAKFVNLNRDGLRQDASLHGQLEYYPASG